MVLEVLIWVDNYRKTMAARKKPTHIHKHCGKRRSEGLAKSPSKASL
jgi:hypothetical protein